MIESTKFKKMLNILKTDAKDINVDISIIDYDTTKECDYEKITFYLKETNTQNGAAVYKSFTIFSQLYYDENTDKYYSALDGEIISKDKKKSTLGVVTQIDNDTFKKNKNEDDDKQVELVVKLIDADTQEPINNQIIYMYISSSPDDAMLSVKTDASGQAKFKFLLSNFNILSDLYLIHFEYRGNRIYQPALSAYTAVNIEDVKSSQIQSDVTACMKANGSIAIKYKTSFNNKNLSRGFKDYNNSFDVQESDLIAGKVFFYIIRDNVRMYLGGASLINDVSKSYASITSTFPDIYYNQDITIEAEFEGNNYFSKDIATASYKFNRTAPANIVLKIIDDDGNNINVINKNGFNTQLSFDINASSLTNNPDLYESGFETLYRSYGHVSFYLQNADGEWGTLGSGLPFYIADNLVLTDSNHISTETDFLIVNLDSYGLQENSSLYIKAEYSGNAIINAFSVSNKTR